MPERRLGGTERTRCVCVCVGEGEGEGVGEGEGEGVEGRRPFEVVLKECHIDIDSNVFDASRN